MVAAGIGQPGEKMQILPPHAFRPMDEHDGIPRVTMGEWMSVARSNANALGERRRHSAGA
jgi:hypothetical protein